MRTNFILSRCSIIVFVVLTVCAVPSLLAQPETYFVPNVVDQFQKLSLRPDGLGFSIGNTHNPSLNKHYQGMARRNGSGEPYLFVTQSNNDTTTCVGCNDNPGKLIIVKMGSRDTSGERLRTNRLIRDWVPYVRDSNGDFVIGPDGRFNWTKPPDPQDKVVRVITFDGEIGLPSYRHPGGVQLVGDILAVPLENPHRTPFPENAIQFLDVSNPENPQAKSFLRLENSDEFSAGVVGITPFRNPNGPGNRYLMMVSGGENRELRLYRSNPTNSDGSTDLKSLALRWSLIGSTDCPTPAPGAPVCHTLSFPNDWKFGTDSYQMYNFVRQGSMDGQLFLFGAYNSGIGGDGDDILQLFRVNVDQYGTPGTTFLQAVGKTRLSSYPVNGHGDSAALSAAVGVYVSPSGELILYSTEYENDGPYELTSSGLAGPRTVRFGEWRHREIVRPDSPTYKPSVEINGPFEVDEGSSVTISAQAKPAITKAWLQLFEDDGAGLSLPSVVSDDDWLLMDLADYDKDHFDRLSTFDSTTGTQFDDNAGSWRWFAPEGCNIRVNGGTISEPQRGKMLVGDGKVHEKRDLDQVSDDQNDGSMDDMISSIQIRFGDDPTPRCENYYNATIGVRWDVNNDNIFETVGLNPLFSAAELDGPSNPTINAQAKHPTDSTALGHSDALATTIRVKNVAPAISDFKVVDSLGFKVGTDVPFALPFVEYTGEAFFTDPGKPDHQTAVINFGDGSVIQSSNFDLFSDAFGGVVGRGYKRHIYNSAGDFTLQFGVIDDDGGQTAVSKTIKVAAPAEILQWVVSEIDLKIATSPNSSFAKALIDSRSSLTGNNGGGAHNGAIDKIASGDLVAAIVKITQAVSAIERAEAAGAGNLTALKFYLSLTGEAIAQKAYLDAVSAIGTPNLSQAAKLQNIRNAISNGHIKITTNQYIAGLEYFKDAISRTSSMS